MTLVGPHWYQILHPWHWLTYGQNGRSPDCHRGARLCWTNRLHGVYPTDEDLQQDTRKGELFPTLALSSYKEKGTKVIAVVTNVGRGAALDAVLWHQMVSDGFELDEFILQRKSFSETLFVGALTEGEQQIVEITFNVSKE